MVLYRNVRADLKFCELCYKGELVDLYVSLFAKKPPSRMTKWDLSLAITKGVKKTLANVVEKYEGKPIPSWHTYKRTEYEKTPENIQKIIFLLQDEDEGWLIKW